MKTAMLPNWLTWIWHRTESDQIKIWLYRYESTISTSIKMVERVEMLELVLMYQTQRREGEVKRAEVPLLHTLIQQSDTDQKLYCY